MGEVYKATDTRLSRTVAIKVLPPRFAADPDMRGRFEREAQTIAGLNHPHICTLHDVGRHDGVEYLVMEYLEGETLADRLGPVNGRSPTITATLVPALDRPATDAARDGVLCDGRVLHAVHKLERPR